MYKIKRYLKDIFYTICFLFRPATTVVVSFVLMLIVLSILIVVILCISQDTRMYEILLAVLTGISASFFVSITIELCNNYHFNSKRQRELREYFSLVSNYRIRQAAFEETFSKYEVDHKVGSGKVYVVLYQLKEIIPQLRKSLEHRDYLYRKEINAVDDVLYDYESLFQIITLDLLPAFLDLICSISEGTEIDDNKGIKDYGQDLFNLLKKEAGYYVANNDKENPDFYEAYSEYLKAIIEKSLFYNMNIFVGYFKVTDGRYIVAESNNLEDLTLEKALPRKQATFNFRSDMISLHCGRIDKSMIRLQQRVAKEPYFGTMIEYANENM